MKETIEGIVLNETNFGETSKILNILTKEHGYISVMSKGSRTLKSKLRGISMKLVYANFTIKYKENGISTLIEGNVINSLKYILSDFKKINYANYLISIYKSILKDNNEKELYQVLRDSLLKINENFDPELITNIVLIKLLNYLGVKPNLDECVSCSSHDILTFDINLGGVICKNCYQDTYLFQTNTLKLLKLFQIVDISKIDKLNITSEKVKEEINQFIKEYYETYTGIYIKNRDKVQVELNW